MKITYEIFGPDIGGLKRNTTRRSKPHVQLNTQPLPDDVMECHREATIRIDVMFVCGLQFAVQLVSQSSSAQRKCCQTTKPTHCLEVSNESIQRKHTGPSVLTRSWLTANSARLRWRYWQKRWR